MALLSKNLFLIKNVTILAILLCTFIALLVKKSNYCEQLDNVLIKKHAIENILHNKNKLQIMAKHKISGITMNDFEEFIIKTALLLHIKLEKIEHNNVANDILHKSIIKFSALVWHDESAFTFLEKIEDDFSGFCCISDVKISRVSGIVTQTPVLSLECSCIFYWL